MLHAPGLRDAFENGMRFDDLATHARAFDNEHAWRERYERLELDEHQRQVGGSFTRRMHILSLTGPWCGDCALQGAALQRVAEASDGIEVRFLDRNEHAELQVKAPINAGFRVPVTWFLDEDFEVLARMGDRTLSRYRSMARKALGEECGVLAPQPQDPVREVLSEVLAEIERLQLMLRLSPRLRERHGD